MDVLEEQVAAAIDRHAMLSSAQTVLVALSGGPDSVALLRVLLALSKQPRRAYRVRAAHVNHQLRGDQSKAEERFVARLCVRHKVALSRTRLPVPEGGNREQELRRQRYRYLSMIAATEQAVVATGHQLDDQAETFLLKAVRGAGLAGLAAIPFVRILTVENHEVSVIRPLLTCRRNLILSYLERLQQSYCRDPDNRDLQLDRNWVREHLIVPAEKRLNPRLVENLGRSTDLLRSAADFLENEGAKLLQACQPRSRLGMVLDAMPLQGRPTALVQAALRCALRRVKGSLRHFEFTHVEALRELLESRRSGGIDLPKGLRAELSCGLLRLGPALVIPQFCYRLTIPGQVFVKETGARLRAVRSLAHSAPDVGWWFESKEENVKVRNRRPGDRIFSRGRERKLKDEFQHFRVPSWERDRLLVVEQHGRPVWVQALARQTPAPSSSVRLQILSEASPAQ